MNKGTMFALLIIGIVAVGGYAVAHGAGKGMVDSEERMAMHEQMQELMETGSFSDLEALREETGKNIAPWVESEEQFGEFQEHHKAMMENHGEGGCAMGCGGMGRMHGSDKGMGKGHGGCPMMDLEE